MSECGGFSLWRTALLLFLTMLFHSTPSSAQVPGPAATDRPDPKSRHLLYQEFLEWKQRHNPDTPEPPSAAAVPLPGQPRAEIRGQTGSAISVGPTRPVTSVARQTRIAAHVVRTNVWRPGASSAASERRVRAPRAVASVARALKSGGQRVGNALTCLIARGCVSPAHLAGTVVGAAAGGVMGGAGGAVAGGVVGAAATAPGSPLVNWLGSKKSRSY